MTDDFFEAHPRSTATSEKESGSRVSIFSDSAFVALPFESSLNSSITLDTAELNRRQDLVLPPVGRRKCNLFVVATPSSISSGNVLFCFCASILLVLYIIDFNDGYINQ